MTDKKKLARLAEQRNPLSSPREIVKPTNLYGGTLVGKTTKPQVVKYTTHLRPETIKALKGYAVEHDLKDYEVVQQAIESYLEVQTAGPHQ